MPAQSPIVLIGGRPQQLAGADTLIAATPALSDSSTQLATTAFLSRAMATVMSVDVSAGPTLNAAQVQSPVLVFTGALTVATAVVFPATGEWNVINRTTGAFTLTCKTAAGTGITVAQGFARVVIADGTNVVAGASDLPTYEQTGVTNTTPITAFPIGFPYFFNNAQTAGGFPNAGYLLGLRTNSAEGIQQLVGQSGQLYERTWNNVLATPAWNPWNVQVSAVDYGSKGALVSASSPNAPVTLGVGTDGQVLTASAAAASGLSWATPAAAGGVSGANALGSYIVQTALNAPANAQILANLATSILKVTTTTGVLSAAVAADFPVLNQNTTGTAANITGVLLAASHPAITGDVTGAVSTVALTLATVNANVGTFNSVTVNGKGLVTAATNVIAQGSAFVQLQVQAAVTSTATTTATATLIDATNLLWTSVFVPAGRSVFLEILASATAGSPTVILTPVGSALASFTLVGTASTTTVRTRSPAIVPVSGTEYQARLFNSVAGTASVKVIRLIVA